MAANSGAANAGDLRWKLVHVSGSQLFEGLNL